MRQTLGLSVTLARALITVLASMAVTAAPYAVGGTTREESPFLDVPAGEFTMGADRTRDPEAFDNERWSPAQGEGRVHVPRYLIARTPVTVTDFGAFARESRWTVDQRALTGAALQPVTFVSWPDALAYCRWLERALKNSPATPPVVKDLLADGWRVTLPSEAEWEKAARAFARDQFAWGSVAEWTRSPYQPYPYTVDDDRSNLESDALWVIRGGVFDEKMRTPRPTARTGADPGARRPFIGFRVAISAPRS